LKKILIIIFCLLLSGVIVIGYPLLINDNKKIDADHTNRTSLIKQEVISNGENKNTYYKIYNQGQLIGVINDYDYIKSLIAKHYADYEDDFPNSELGLGEDVYVVAETSFLSFENIDDNIMAYLVNNNLLGVKVTAVEFSTDEGVYDIIYVKDIQDFYDARDRFLLNFVSKETLNKLSNNIKIESPTDYGSVEKSVSIEEKTSNKEVIVSPENVFKDADEVYQYLCYGRNEEREYYTTVEGDTLQAVGYHNNDMSPKQIVMLNPDVLSSENQIITPGMELNVTYYTSPLTVDVVKENLSQQLIYPEAPTYVQDDTLEPGEINVLVQEEIGSKNVLYEEVWKNGVLQSGELKSETILKQPVQGIIAVGTKGTYLSGTNNFIWPVDNPLITCHWGCYFNHTGTDFVNRYNRYGNVYAADSGVVYSVGYAWDMGYYCMIDHQNGLKTYYMHLNTPAYPDVGDSVTRGEIIGQIGNTGNSDGAHLHFTILDDNERVDACYYLPCALVED